MLKKYIRENFSVSAVYSSDLARAKETVESLSLSCGVPLLLSKNLREINAGLWQGKTMSEIESLYPEQSALWHSDMSLCRPEGGESVKEAVERVIGKITDIAEKHDGKTVAVCVHGLAIRALFCYALNLPLSKMNTVKFVSNASISTFTYANGIYKSVEYDNADYLGNLSTNMPEKF